MLRGFLASTMLIAMIVSCAQSTRAQSFGIELHNTQMPASGGMGGASLARPQDPLSAINGNPATLSQMSGTNFTFGGTFIDPTVTMDQTASFPVANPIVTPFTSQSSYPPSVLGNIGVTQQLDLFGTQATAGLGFVSNAGAGSTYASVPQSNGAGSSLLVLELVAGLGAQVTENVSAGASFQFGTGILDPPFVGIGRSTPAYAPRGSFGLDYDAGNATTMGVYYQTRQNFKFEDSILLETPGGTFLPSQDVSLGLPRNIGFGVANSSLMDGQLLLAADVLWKNWEDTDLMGAIYHDQWVVQLGSQYTQGRCKYRAGYVWAENPVKQLDSTALGGVVPPGALAAAQFVQAQLAVVSQHRLTAGIGVSNVLPNVDLDLNVGGMLHDSERLGATNIGISSYWVAFGLTWHFGPCGGACGESCGESCSGGF